MDRPRDPEFRVLHAPRAPNPIGSGRLFRPAFPDGLKLLTLPLASQGKHFWTDQTTKLGLPRTSGKMLVGQLDLDQLAFTWLDEAQPRIDDAPVDITGAPRRSGITDPLRVLCGEPRVQRSSRASGKFLGIPALRKAVLTRQDVKRSEGERVGQRHGQFFIDGSQAVLALSDDQIGRASCRERV